MNHLIFIFFWTLILIIFLIWVVISVRMHLRWTSTWTTRILSYSKWSLARLRSFQIIALNLLIYVVLRSVYSLKNCCVFIFSCKWLLLLKRILRLRTFISCLFTLISWYLFGCVRFSVDSFWSWIALIMISYVTNVLFQRQKAINVRLLFRLLLYLRFWNH
jgi:hypothetical protein